MEDKRSRGADRLKAAQIFIDRHHPVQTTHHVTVEHVDDRRMVEFAMKLADELGIESQKLIGRIDGQLIEQGLSSSALPALQGRLPFHLRQRFALRYTCTPVFGALSPAQAPDFAHEIVGKLDDDPAL